MVLDDSLESKRFLRYCFASLLFIVDLTECVSSYQLYPTQARSFIRISVFGLDIAKVQLLACLCRVQFLMSISD